MRTNTVKAIMASGKTALVGWASIGNGFATELMGHSGFDGVVVDLQHGQVYLDQAIGMLQALSSTPATPLARVSENNFFEINKILDSGAYGVIVPMIDTVEDAKRVVDAVRYPPVGRRSYGPARGFLYGGADYFDHANDTLLAFAMIETPQGMANLDAIAAVEGIDGLFVGPGDLSIALGVPPTPRWRDEPLRGAITRIHEAARANGKLAGIFCTSLEMAVDMRVAGFDMVVPGNDAMLMRSAAQAWCDRIRGADPAAPAPGY